MARETRITSINSLLIMLLAYCAASLFHYAHNAAYLDAYPNMPGWLSAPKVAVAWLGVTAIGVAGYLLLRRGWWLPGLLILGAYGALGLDGLAHYSLAPLAAHSLTMNLTIWLEAITGSIVLLATTVAIYKKIQQRREAV